MNVTAISPTAYNLFWTNIKEYYKQYFGERARIQTYPMMAGSAFDILVKDSLSKDLQVPSKKSVQELFSQFPEGDRKLLEDVGKYLLENYKSSGAYADLLVSLEASIVEPAFEFYVEKEIAWGSFTSVPIKGFPDCFFMTESETRVTVDWKVNGYFSKSGGGSPKPLYVKSFPSMKVHKNAEVANFRGMQVNLNGGLENTDKSWAIQQCMYNWSLGAPVGSGFIVILEQLVAKYSALSDPMKDKPLMTFYSYRSVIRKAFQQELFVRLWVMWQIIHSDHFFRGDLEDYVHRLFEAGGPIEYDKWEIDKDRSARLQKTLNEPADAFERSLSRDEQYYKGWKA